jgi:hypothetical protein
MPKCGFARQNKSDNRQLKVKVKQTHHRLGVAQRGSRKLRFPDFMTTAQDSGKVVSPTHRPPLPPGKQQKITLRKLNIDSENMIYLNNIYKF